MSAKCLSVSSRTQCVLTVTTDPIYSELENLEELEIWGLGTQNLPYDGYLPIKLAFDPFVAGKAEICDILAVVCPHPPGASKISLIIGTNTDLLRRLPEQSTSNPSVHPMLRQVYQCLVQEEKAPAEVVGLNLVVGPK